MPIASLQQHPSFGDRRSVGWHNLDGQSALERLSTNQATGLSDDEHALRFENYGSNEFESDERRTSWSILTGQLKSSLVLLLFVAMIVSLILGETSDAVAVGAIIILNTLLGFWQDFQAEKSLAELKKLSIPEVIVRRNGQTKSVLAPDLVPGDIVFLRAGYFVPADCRLLQTTDFTVDESALTGESIAVEKTVLPLETQNLALGDRTNLAYMGTMATHGHAEALVVATGMHTQLGLIADSLKTVESEPTPMQVRLAQLSRTLAVIAIGIVGFVFIAGTLAGQPPRLMLMTALSLAVAIVPEGLPAVATVSLALGARRMFQKNALIRRLPAVESLGSVTTICSDKTGTLTKNEMTVTSIDLLEIRLHPLENASATLKASDYSHPDALKLLLMAGCLCNDAQLQPSSDRISNSSTHESPEIVGEPTEKAFIDIAYRFNINQRTLQKCLPRIGEVAFDSKRKRMTTQHGISDRNTIIQVAPSFIHDAANIVFAKGAVDSILEICDRVWVGDRTEPLDVAWRNRIKEIQNDIAGQGSRVLATAFRPDRDRMQKNLESRLVFIGMVGLTDPPRPEVADAVAKCQRAGIRPMMITGDHPLTAISIAKQLGITKRNVVVTGSELAEISQEELKSQVAEVDVFARVAPADKLKIVQALQHHHEVVAMTGDGVNDAPALKQAHVGVAMGRTGTDVSKQAAEMVLLDDNFATIVSAVEQGRIVYDNIRKFVKYTMSSNMGEVLVMTLGVMLGLPLPLLPLQILWVNLVTDGLPGLALAMEPMEKDTMNRRPIPLDIPIFDRPMTWRVIWIGSWIGLVSLATACLLLGPQENNVDTWRTLVFTVLTFAQMGNALACRSEQSIFRGFAVQQNGWLWGAIASTCVLQLAVIYVPTLQNLFHTVSLSLEHLAICFAVGCITYIAIELAKLLQRRKEQTDAPSSEASF